MKKIEDKIDFINISTNENTLCEWKPTNSFKNYALEMNYVRKDNNAEGIYFHINKGHIKLVHIRRDDFIYTVGAKNTVQYQLLEGLLEFIHEKFHQTYDLETILSYGHFSENTFKPFINKINFLFTAFKKSDKVKKVDIFCKVCNLLLPLYIKRSVIDNADRFPVPIVYDHSGHAILCYIDKHFDLRGVEVVDITG